MITPLKRARSPSGRMRLPAPDGALLLTALPSPVFALDRQGTVRFVNPAAEQFFGAGASALVGRKLARLLLPHSPVLALADTIWRTGGSIAEYDVPIEGPRLAPRPGTIQSAPAGGGGGPVGPGAARGAGGGQKGRPKEPP